MNHEDDLPLFDQGRRASRRERKRLQSADRSKYKKTDQKQRERQVKATPLPDLPVGRVLSITAQGMHIDADGESYICSVRGHLLKEKRRVKSLVTVGDWVFFEPTTAHEGVIHAVKERYSYLARADSLARHHQQLIAANIDLVMITASVVAPRLKPSLVDRYILAARQGKMEPVIVINKIDLLSTDAAEAERYHEFLKAYESLDLSLITVSVKTGVGLDQLSKKMQGKASVFSGQSGVGKSSLITALTGAELATRDVVARTGKGAHTTSTAQLIPLTQGGWCIDTPGIRSFGLWGLDKTRIQDYFEEIKRAAPLCRFPNCTHTHEPNCHVVAQVADGVISPMRYESYRTLLEGTEDHRRR